MIDGDLLRQLGWSNDLIDEVTRVAEPMRVTCDKSNFATNLTTPNYSVGSSIYANQDMNGTSQTIHLKPHDG
jgi:hypothetical protein